MKPKHQLFSISKLLLSILFAAIAFIYFSYLYQFHLHFEEQLQMFLFTKSYFYDFLSRPGGLTDYLSTFFMQFYFVSWAGALIIALLLILLQYQIFSISSAINNYHKTDYFPIFFIPSFIIWGLLCNENISINILITSILVLLFVQMYLALKKRTVRWIFFLFASPFLFWIAGGEFWIFNLICFVIEIFYYRYLKISEYFVLALLMIVTTSSPIIFSWFAKLQYPLSRLWWGPWYSRYPIISPATFLLSWLSIPFSIFITTILPEISKRKKAIILKSLLFLVIFSGGIFVVISSSDQKKEKIMSYDYYARNEKWDKIIELANKEDPKDPLSVTCLNLALAKTGVMGDAMFRYFQNGIEGLLPTFQRDFVTPFVAGEVYYHLGFLNTSLRYNFEAMEAIPDHKKSVRAMKRMAEVNLLNEEYNVAEKYLKLLSKTLFYREWAKHTLSIINNPKAISENTEWAELKKYQFTEDFLFSEQEKDQMLGLSLLHCPTNKMVYEYLMAYTLLNRDLKHFYEYYPLGKEIHYKKIPSHYQEALILFWSIQPLGLDNIPNMIDAPVKQKFIQFVNDYSSEEYKTKKELFQKKYSQTYWHYYYFIK